MNWPHCPTAQHSDQTHPAPNPQFTLCNILTAILMATLCWHSNQLPTSPRLEEKSGQKNWWKWIREKVMDQQKVLRESLIKFHICGATWSLLALALRKHTLHWPVSQRGRRELCYSEARLTHWCRGTPQRGKTPVFVPARDHRTTGREGDTDGQVIKKITIGDNKCMKTNVGNRETL